MTNTTRIQWAGDTPQYVSTDEAIEMLEGYTQTGAAEIVTRFGESLIRRTWYKSMGSFVAHVTTETEAPSTVHLTLGAGGEARLANARGMNAYGTFTHCLHGSRLTNECDNCTTSIMADAQA